MIYQNKGDLQMSNKTFEVPSYLVRWYWKNGIDFLPNPKKAVEDKIDEVFHEKIERELIHMFPSVNELMNG